MPDRKRSAESGNNDLSTFGPSQALLAAQRHLEQLRAERKRPQRTSGGIFRPQGSTHQPGPAGFSWAGLPLTPIASSVSRPSLSLSSGSELDATSFAMRESSAADQNLSPTIRLQPALALAILGAEKVPAGRVWLLLRFLDEEGRGWHYLEAVREQLTRKKSDSHNESKTCICGRRQLRNLLNQGQGIFWEKQQARAGHRERIWLKSPARVAHSLGLERLAGKPVKIPLAALLGGIGQVRAYFYATFHSGRQAGAGPGAPISRSRLADLTQVPPRTQRIYDQAAGVKREANYAVGAEYSSESIQERAWRHGRAVFKFVDHQGKHGQAGRHYVAWRLPNSYAIDDNGASSGKRKRNNRRPVDLVTKGAQGNDRSLRNCPWQSKALFHPNGGAAGQAYNRDCSVDAYWPEARRSVETGCRPVKIWQVIDRSASR